MARAVRKNGKPSTKSAQEVDDMDDETDEESGEESEDRPEARVPRPAFGFGSASHEPRAASSSELVDFSAWPGSSDAAKIAQVHPTTIKNWRNQGRLKAVMDQSGNWRHDPDSLAELVGAPETTDPATLLATGMTSIVQQGERAGDRLLAMTEITTAGMKQTLEIMGHELERAYARIEILEKERSDLLDKSATALEANFKHQRWLKRIDNEHEMSMTDKKDGAGRLAGLLEILGPIGASIAARVVGNEMGAQKAEARAISQTNGGRAHETVETKVTRALGDLATAVRSLDDSEFKAFRLMLPEDVGRSLDAVRSEHDGGKVGEALAKICKTACSLPREQFDALAPIAPKAVATALTELRHLINEEK